jgi:hypothetical protein
LRFSRRRSEVWGAFCFLALGNAREKSGGG